MQFEDKTLSCRDCHQPFTFTAGEQDFFALRQLMNEPKRCPNCRLLVRLQKTGKDPSQCTEVPCDDCGAATRIPFKPTGAKPVYCAPCLHVKRHAQAKCDNKEIAFTQVSCDDCGMATHVPFKPTGLKPLYCAPCLRIRRSSQES